jgi:hypothetical protein
MPPVILFLKRPLLSPWSFLLDEKLRRQFGAASKQPRPIAKPAVAAASVTIDRDCKADELPTGDAAPRPRSCHHHGSLTRSAIQLQKKSPLVERQTEAKGTIAYPQRIPLVGMPESGEALRQHDRACLEFRRAHFPVRAAGSWPTHRRLAGSQMDSGRDKS